MQSSNFTKFSDSLARAETEARKLVGNLKQWLPQASWLEILLVCIPLALAVTLFPVVLTLFVLGIIGKWLLTPSPQPTPASAQQPPTDVIVSNGDAT